MSNSLKFENNTSLIKIISEKLVKGSLTLVLGSGISKSFGLPDWDKLVERLYNNEGETYDPSKNSPEDAIEYLLIEHFDNNKDQLIKKTKQALYETAETDVVSLRKNDTFASIASLIMSSSRGSVSKVITFNYDDFIEKYLKFHGFVVQSIPEDTYWEKYSDVKVFHPHGFIPIGTNSEESKNIVFSTSSYLEFKETEPWYNIVLSQLRTNFCIFLGLSGRDLNLKRLINDANKQHVINTEDLTYWGIALVHENDHKVQKTLWENRGVFPKEISSFDDEIPDLFFKICQKAASIRK